MPEHMMLGKRLGIETQLGRPSPCLRNLPMKHHQEHFGMMKSSYDDFITSNLNGDFLFQKESVVHPFVPFFH